MKDDDDNKPPNSKNILKGDVHDVDNFHQGDNIINNYYKAKKLSKELTTVLPRLPHENLIGRKEVLEDLYRLLSNNNQSVVITGMGGLGKTAVAQSYISKYYDVYAHIVWISFDTSNKDVVADFVNARGLLSNLNILVEDHSIEELFEQIIQALKNISAKPCLLILDNVPKSISPIYDLLPNQPHWHLLATARGVIEGFTSYSLNFLDLKEAVALFEKYYTRNLLDPEFLEQIIKELEYHTLTIEILARMAQKHRYDEHQLREALPSNLLANVVTKHRGSTVSIERITDYLCAIFEIQLQNLSIQHKRLLNNFLCLPPDFHPYEILADLLNLSATPTAHTLSSTLDSLHETGWLLYSTGPHEQQNDAYKMHRIINEVTKRLLDFKLEDVMNLLDNLTDKLSLEDEGNPTVVFPWIPYGSSTLVMVNDFSSDIVLEFKVNLAYALKSVDAFAQAKNILEPVLVHYIKTFGDTHETTSILYSHLAEVFFDLGDIPSAKILQQKAVQADEMNFGKNHPTTILSYGNLIHIHRELGDFGAAKNLAHYVIEYNEQSYGLDAIETAHSYELLASICIETGAYTQAKSLLQHSITISEKHLDADHPNLASLYSNIAMALQELEELDEAKNFLYKAIAIDEANYGFNHSITNNSYSNLGVLLWSIGELEDAKSLLEKVTNNSEELFGFDHILTARSYANMALVHHDLGNLSQAELLFRRAIAIDTTQRGVNHTSTATNQFGLAEVLIDLNQYKEALNLMQQAYQTFSEALPPDHPKNITVKDSINYLKNIINNDQ